MRFPCWVWKEKGFRGELLQNLASLPSFSSKLFLQVRSFEQAELARSVLELSKWHHRSTWTSEDRLVLEAGLVQLKTETTLGHSSMQDLITYLGDGLVLDPMAYDLGILDAAESSGLRALLVQATEAVPQKVLARGGYRSEATWPWLPAFLESVSRCSLQRSCELASVSRSHVYRLMGKHSWLAALVEAQRPGPSS